MSRRPYRSALRTEQAANTRRRILRAAAGCFAEQGYGRTTLAQIATAAGVSVETVKGQGAKRDLLLAAFEQAFTGQEGQQPLHQQDRLAAILELPDGDRLIDAAVEFLAAANRRSYALWRALTSAADTDPAVAELRQEILQRRRVDIESAMGVLQRRGLLPRGPRQRPRAAAACSFLLSHEGYQQLVAESGWSDADYEAWIRTMIRAALRLGLD